MQSRLTLVPLILTAALAGCGRLEWPTSVGEPPQIYGVGCPFAPGVALDGGGLGQAAAPLAIGESRSFGATLDWGPGECAANGQPFRRIEWFDLNYAAVPRIQIRLESCEDCTVLYEGREGSPYSEGIKGAALVNGPQRVVLRVTGLAPGRSLLYLKGCTDFEEPCGTSAASSLSLQVR